MQAPLLLSVTFYFQTLSGAKPCSTQARQTLSLHYQVSFPPSPTSNMSSNMVISTQNSKTQDKQLNSRFIMNILLLKYVPRTENLLIPFPPLHPALLVKVNTESWVKYVLK